MDGLTQGLLIGAGLVGLIAFLRHALYRDWLVSHAEAERHSRFPVEIRGRNYYLLPAPEYLMLDALRARERGLISRMVRGEKEWWEGRPGFDWDAKGGTPLRPGS